MGWSERELHRLRYNEARDAKRRGNVIHWEPGTPGFGLRCYTSGERRFIASTSVKDAETGKWRTRLFVVGNPDAKKPTALRVARVEAERLLTEMRGGSDPRAKQEAVKEASELAKTTLRAAVRHYVELRNSSAGTKRVLQSAISTHLEDWLDQPLLEITRPMVKLRYKAIPERIQARAQARIDANKALPKKKRHAFKRDVSYFNGETADKVFRNLSVVWDFWLEDHVDTLQRQRVIVPTNPCKAVNSVRVARAKTQKDLSDEQLTALYACLPKVEGWGPLLFRLLMLTGGRAGATMALEWEHVKSDRIEVPADIESGKVRMKHRQQAQPWQVIPVTAAIKKVLEEIRAAGKQAVAERRATAEQAARFLFPSDKSPRGHLTNQQHFVELLARESGVFFTSSWTRTAAVRLIQKAGFSKADAEATLNHADSRPTGDAIDHYWKTELTKRGLVLEGLGKELARLAKARL